MILKERWCSIHVDAPVCFKQDVMCVILVCPSQEERKNNGKETTQAIHQESPKFQADEGKSSQKLYMVLIKL